MQLGFIGLGVMGEPMCRNLRQRSGYAVLAYDVRAEPLQRLIAAGVEAAAAPGDVLVQGEVVFLSLPSGAELESLAYQPDGLLASISPGQTIVDLGTSPLGLTRRLAEEVTARGAHYLDAPVARTRQAAEDGTLAIMAGGAAEVLERVRPLLACFATDITYCGASGAGQVAKILNNMVLFQTVAALAEARAIGAASGVDPRVLFEALAKGSADSFALRNHGMKALLPRRYPQRAFSLDYARKDLAYALDMAAAAGIDASRAGHLATLFERARAAGWGDKYFPVIAELLNSA
jgi:3-hydroxyisobutyrate dehydrogenase-like beta-hydroxyacid dehydrogenase